LALVEVYMKSVAAVLIILFVACVTRSGGTFAEEYSGADELLERLVSDLALIDAPAPGLTGMANYSTFMAEDEEPGFSGGVLGVPRPTISPQMRELVRRGLAALPVLIRHLDDRRATKLTIEDSQILTYRVFGEEYDPRTRPACYSACWQDRREECAACVRERRKQEEQWPPIDGAYQVKIGDVCFVLIGQIVNRNLNAVRYQPSGNQYVNSPVERPSLAEKVRADWAGLDAQAHEASLRADVNTHPLFREALARLRFYYPTAYAALAGDDAKKREKFEVDEKKARATTP
jgi:hypothetical protein